MQIIGGARRSGKTAKLLEWIREQPYTEDGARVIVTPTRDEAMRLLRENPDLETWRFVSIGELRDPGPGLWDGKRAVLALDNLEQMLSGLVAGGRYPVELATSSSAFLWLTGGLDGPNGGVPS